MAGKMRSIMSFESKMDSIHLIRRFRIRTSAKMERASQFNLKHALLPVAGKQILILQYSGILARGSGCNDACDEMLWQGRQIVQKVHPHAILIDFSDLEYSWGNRLDGIMDIGYCDEQIQGWEDGIHTAILAGPQCEAGLRTLFMGERSAGALTDLDFAFTDKAEAIAWLLRVTG